MEERYTMEMMARDAGAARNGGDDGSSIARDGRSGERWRRIIVLLLKVITRKPGADAICHHDRKFGPFPTARPQLELVEPGAFSGWVPVPAISVAR